VITTPTPRATRGGSFTAPVLTQLVSPHKHYKHRAQANGLQGYKHTGIFYADWRLTEPHMMFRAAIRVGGGGCRFPGFGVGIGAAR
jgi:hypothetical protein